MKIHLKLAGYLAHTKTVEVLEIAQAYTEAELWGEELLRSKLFGRDSVFEVHLYRDDPNVSGGRGKHLGSINIIAARAPEELPLEGQMVIRVPGGTALAQRTYDIVNAALKANGITYPQVSVSMPAPAPMPF